MTGFVLLNWFHSVIFLRGVAHGFKFQRFENQFHHLKIVLAATKTICEAGVDKSLLGNFLWKNNTILIHVQVVPQIYVHVFILLCF